MVDDEPVDLLMVFTAEYDAPLVTLGREDHINPGTVHADPRRRCYRSRNRREKRRDLDRIYIWAEQVAQACVRPHAIQQLSEQRLTVVHRLNHQRQAYGPALVV